MTILDAARLCDRAYSTCTIQVRRPGVDVQVLVDDVLAARVVAIRGTSEAPDWITNARAWPAPEAISHGLYHAGAWRSASALIRPLSSYLSDRPLILAGHSLGGMVALALAARLPRPPVEVITFGSPPSCRPWGQIRCPVIRAENYRDPVPRLRIWSLYQPAGDLIWIDRDGVRHQDRPREIRDYRSAVAWSRYAPGNLQYHAMSAYVAALSRTP